MRTGMPARMAGCTVEGAGPSRRTCASAEASSNDSRSTARARPKSARVGGEHAVDIGPDLNLGRAEARADERRRVVRPAPAERRRHALGRRADEAAQHGNRAAVDERAHVRGELVCRRAASGDACWCRLSVTTTLARVDPFGRHAGVLRMAATSRLLASSPCATMASEAAGGQAFTQRGRAQTSVATSRHPASRTREAARRSASSRTVPASDA